MAGIIKVNQYQDFNGNTILTSDGNGNLTTQEILYPAFLLKGSGTNQSIPNASFTKVTAFTEIFDTDNAVSSGTFTVPTGKGGKYFITASTNFTANATGQRIMSFYKNGSQEARLSSAPGEDTGNNAGNTGSALIELSEGDYVELYVYQNKGGALNLLCDDDRLRFQGFKIGS